MADNLGINTGAGGPVAADEISSVFYQRIKLIHGADGVNAGDVSDANPLPIDDAGGSITVDNAQLSVVGGGTEAAAMRVTIANNSTGVLSVDDNGSTLSVDDGAGSLTIDSTQLPASLGQKTSANSFAVVLASDDILQIATSPDRVSVINIPGTTVAASAVTYSTGDLIGSKIDLSSIFGGRDAGILDSITIITKGLTTNGGMSLILFNADPSATTFTDDAAFSIETADIAKVIYSVLIPAADFSATSTEKIVSISVDAIISTSTLYAAIVAQGTTTWPAINDGLSLSVAMSVI